jgi:urea transporter
MRAKFPGGREEEKKNRSTIQEQEIPDIRNIRDDGHSKIMFVTNHIAWQTIVINTILSSWAACFMVYHSALFSLYRQVVLSNDHHCGFSWLIVLMLLPHVRILSESSDL